MYLEQAITRINNIDWDKIGTNSSREDGDLGATFLYRLADFYSETLLKPYPPMVSDIAMLMGDRGEVNFDEYYSDKTKKFLIQTEYHSQRDVVEYYLKLSQLADRNPEVGKYIKVYEPLIEIFERGGSFILRKDGLDIKDIVYIPLYTWFEKFKKK
ncbi:hypothetical protein D3Z55_23585 [Clostridiaceae bacterium]|nr:hypothetical protein [Clostridiaceae bacterium]